MKIWFNIPWSQEKNLGKAYNDFIELIPEEDYACFLDGDAMFLTTYFGKQLYDIVEKYPKCGVFTCRASRIGNKWQRSIMPWEADVWESNDIAGHRHQAATVQKVHYLDITDVTQLGTDHPMGGVLILISKKAWRTVGGFADGILGVDNKLHWACIAKGEKVYLMEGVYVYHWYRGGDATKRDHLL